MEPYCNHAVWGSCPVCGADDAFADQPEFIDPSIKGIQPANEPDQKISELEKRISELTTELEQARRERDKNGIPPS